MNKSALFLTVRNTHFNEVKPVIEKLKANGWSIREFHFEAVWERMEKLLRYLKRQSSRSFYETSEPKAQGKRKLKLYSYASICLYYLLRLACFQWPAILVVLTATPPCKIAMLTYKRMKLPSVLLLHTGILGNSYASSEFDGFSKIAVVSEHAKETLLNCGVLEDKLIVTGRPSNDSLVNGAFDKGEICRRLGLDPSRRIVTYTTENVPEVSLKILEKLSQVLKNGQLLVKVHPSESLRPYKSIGTCVVIKDFPINEVLYVSDVVVNAGLSSTVLDAMLLDKPVVIVNLSGLPESFPYVSGGGAIGIDNLDDLENALHKAFSLGVNTDRDRERFLLEHVFKRDGLATERTVNLLEQVLDDVKERWGSWE